LWGAWRLFGRTAEYHVCVNSLPLAKARNLARDVPDLVRWHDVSHEIPAFICERLAHNLAEGVAWKFAPLRIAPDRFELALDNDCILWDLPLALEHWFDLSEPPRTIIAADTRRMLGQFERFCSPDPRNSGIRGLPPGFDLESRLRDLLDSHPVQLASELDEQGLQVAAVTRDIECDVVQIDEVSICSPFPGHSPLPGRCGAHFVGLNSWSLPWDWEGLPALVRVRNHWRSLRRQITERVQQAGRIEMAIA
jgi:hypothetical protein